MPCFLDTALVQLLVLNRLLSGAPPAGVTVLRPSDEDPDPAGAAAYCRVRALRLEHGERQSIEDAATAEGELELLVWVTPGAVEASGVALSAAQSAVAASLDRAVLMDAPTTHEVHLRRRSEQQQPEPASNRQAMEAVCVYGVRARRLSGHTLTPVVPVGP